MSMAYIRSYYNVPAKRGARVRYNGKPGVIVGSDGARLKIRLDGEQSVKAYHPMWHIEYIKAARPAPAGTTDADYAEASRILGRNALVEVDAPEAVAAARAVCDAYTGIARSAPAGSEESEEA